MRIYKVTFALPKIISGITIGLREIETNWVHARDEQSALIMVGVTNYSKKHKIPVDDILYNVREVGFKKIKST